MGGFLGHKPVGETLTDLTQKRKRALRHSRCPLCNYGGRTGQVAQERVKNEGGPIRLRMALQSPWPQVKPLKSAISETFLGLSEGPFSSL